MMILSSDCPDGKLWKCNLPKITTGTGTNFPGITMGKEVQCLFSAPYTCFTNSCYQQLPILKTKLPMKTQNTARQD